MIVRLIMSLLAGGLIGYGVYRFIGVPLGPDYFQIASQWGKCKIIHLGVGGLAGRWIDLLSYAENGLNPDLREGDFAVKINTGK